MALFTQAPPEHPEASADTLATASSPTPWPFLRLLTLCIGFLGIQFGWSIQMGQMGPLLEGLGADPFWLGMIMAAGPTTGILVQPIIGSLSDQCRWSLGRRRPFIIAGALLTVLSLVLMPHSQALWMAAVLLWILDASLNITQGPYRALVPDVVPPRQQAQAYSLMGLTIGLGSVAAFWIASQITDRETLFYCGALAMVAAMAWTVLGTPEKPLREVPTAAAGLNLGGFFAETFATIRQLPLEAKKLCVAHSFTWFGLNCLFIFFSVFVPHHVFGAASPTDPGYQAGVQMASQAYAAMNAVCFVFSALIGPLCNRFSKKAVHTFGLLCMGASLLAMTVYHSPLGVMVAMGVLGIGWATTLSVPFALFSEHLPAGREGVMMGTFNVFIAAPQLLTSLFVGDLVMRMGNNVGVALGIGGVAMLISAVILQVVQEGSPRHAESRP